MVRTLQRTNMDLGKASLRRTGINILYNAVSTKYGLAWTDGRGVFLTPVCVKEESIDRADSLKLGEFECVQSIHWSCEFPGSVCYLCLVHEASVTLWKVTGVAPDLHLKQVRKINATPVPQGVLWSPTRDILCILNRDRASFYFKHSQTKGSYALPPIESGKVTAGCWSVDGKKLLMGIGSIVLIYQWEDIAKSLSDYNLVAWKIPSVEGRLTTLTALSNTWMVGTVELPLESLCQAAHTDMFRLPDTPGDHTSRLLNLQRNAIPSQKTAQLVMFEVPYSQKEPRKIAGAPLRTVVSPDLIHYNSTLRRVTVGSNTQPVLQVFQVTDTQLWKIQDIRLDLDERPKGLCGYPTKSSSGLPPEGILVMAGSVQGTDSAFLPTSTRALYRLSFHYHPYQNPDLAVLERLVSRAGGESMNAVSLDSYTSDSILRELQLPTSNAKVHLLRINPLRQDSNRSETSDSLECASSIAASSPVCSSKRNAVQDIDDLELSLQLSSPFDRNSNRTVKGLVVDASGEDSGGELEVEGISFEDHLPNFVNSLEKITNPSMFSNSNDQKTNYGQGRSQSDVCDHERYRRGGGDFYHQGWTHAERTKPVTNGHCKGKSLDSRSETSGSSDNSTTINMGPRMQRRASLESDLLSARDRVSSELTQQVGSLETKISSQGAQIAKLGERINYISRLLEETALVATNQYQPLSSPELLNVVLDPREEEGDDVSVTKTFVLDNSRLQLEPIKQTFGLLTVEIILDGEPCVVGSNVDGYLPIKFAPNDTIHISGRRATEVLSHSAFVSSI